MEEKNELMVMEETDVMNEENESKQSGMGTGLAMLLGSALTIAIIAGGTRLKKVWRIHKARKMVTPVESEDNFYDDEEDNIAVDESK